MCVHGFPASMQSVGQVLNPRRAIPPLGKSLKYFKTFHLRVFIASSCESLFLISSLCCTHVPAHTAVATTANPLEREDEGGIKGECASNINVVVVKSCMLRRRTASNLPPSIADELGIVPKVWG